MSICGRVYKKMTENPSFSTHSPTNRIAIKHFFIVSKKSNFIVSQNSHLLFVIAIKHFFIAYENYFFIPI